MFESRKWIKLIYLAMCLLVFAVGCSSGETANLDQAEDTSLQIESDANNQQEKDTHANKNRTTADVLDEGAQETKPADSDVEEATAEETLAGTPSAEIELTPSNIQENKVEPASLSTPTVSLAIIGPQGEDYIILEETEVDWQEGDTVLDVLKRVARANKIQMEYRGRNATAYVEGIGNLYEFDRGSLSGWLYRVNGEFPNRSAGVWSVSAGDKIEWLYTIDLGKDVGGYVEGIEG